MKQNRLSVQKAAELMEADAQFIRIALQRGHLPFGQAIKLSSQYSYYISIPKFSEYTGIPTREIEQYCENKKCK